MISLDCKVVRGLPGCCLKGKEAKWTQKVLPSGRVGIGRFRLSRCFGTILQSRTAESTLVEQGIGSTGLVHRESNHLPLKGVGLARARLIAREIGTRQHRSSQVARRCVEGLWFDS